MELCIGTNLPEAELQQVVATMNDHQLKQIVVHLYGRGPTGTSFLETFQSQQLKSITCKFKNMDQRFAIAMV